MDKETILYLVTLFGCFATLTAYLERRDKKNVNDAKWQGGMDAKLDQVLNSTSVLPNMAKEITEASESSKSAHKRIDKHDERILKLENKS